MRNSKLVIKILLAILLLLCLLDMPYGYYQLVRFLAFLGFGFLSYKASIKGNNVEMIFYAALALLFQPFFKVALGRFIWNIIDVIIGLWLLVSIIKKKEN